MVATKNLVTFSFDSENVCLTIVLGIKRSTSNPGKSLIHSHCKLCHHIPTDDNNVKSIHYINPWNRQLDEMNVQT